MSSKKPPNPRHRFPIYCEPGKSRLHYRVLIFKNATDLQREAAATHGHSLRRLKHTKGLCSPFTLRSYRSKARGGGFHTKPICGAIRFTDTLLNSVVIAHECAHAALAYAERRGFRPHAHGDGQFVADDEERYCKVLGDLVGQVYWQLMRRGYETVIKTATKKRGRVFTRSN